MNLYQFILEVNDGASFYEQKEFVLAPNDQMAARFAREFTDQWRPNARHDHELDWYAAPEGWPQWTLAQCKPITHLTVPVVGLPNVSHSRIALIPETQSDP